MAKYIAKYRELRIPFHKSYTKEIDGQTIYVSGQSVRFVPNLYGHGGIFETDDKDIINFLDTDKVCQEMIGRGVFAKMDEKAIESATEKKTIKKKKPTVKAKEKGKTKKTTITKEKPQF